MNITSILVNVMIIALLVSCNDSGSEIENFEALPKSSEIVVQNNKFVLDLLKKIAQNPGADNYMISPVSASLALGMVYNGANGETATAFENTLGYPLASPEEINTVNQALLSHLTDTPKGSILEIANSLWIRDEFSVKEEFISLNKKYYRARVEHLDFSRPTSVDIINNWVKKQTREKIPTIVETLDERLVMLAINALYFNSSWKYRFNGEDTGNSPFYLENGTVKQVDMMQMEGELAVAHKEHYSTVTLPYKNDKFSMVLILPGEKKTVEDLIAELNIEAINNITGNNNLSTIHIKLPKFKFSYEKIFNDALIEMGLGLAFGDNADFSNLSDSGTKISFVLQKTYIDVNEKGTEAAAVTAVGVETTSVGRAPIIFNRPFLFIITEKNTKSIIFTGKVGVPEYD